MRTLHSGFKGLRSLAFLFIVCSLISPALLPRAHAQTRGWSFTLPPNAVTIGGKRNNVFYVGEQVCLWVTSGTATTYAVKDYFGNAIDSGAIGADGSFLPQLTAPGWYKVYVYGSTNQGPPWGNIVGGTTVTVVRPNSNFPSMPDSFEDGRYLIWDVKGNVNITVTDVQPGAANAVISGLFFGMANATPAQLANTNAAQFVGSDSQTEGNWRGVYGTEGYNIIGNQASYPGYASVYAAVVPPFIWAPSSNNPRALLKVSGTDRIAASWYTHPTTFTVNVNTTDGNSHRLAIYAMDWGSAGPRAETITITDATSGAVLDTETLGAINGPQDGLIDELIRGITGMGPQRYQINDATNPDPDVVHIQSEIAVDKQFYTPYDPLRKRVLMIAFPNGPTSLSGVQQVVQTFQNDVKYWEGRNEPNYNYSGSQFVTAELQPFYQTVKGVNSSLKVMGPAIVTIGPGYGLPWIQDFLNGGGANFLDAFSFHAYNNINGDFLLADESLQGLESLLGQYNAASLPLWQTEQGAAAALYGADEPRLQGKWDMVQMMAYEQFGIPKEHNILWYDVSHGYWDVPDFWENADGTLEPAAPLMRVWSEELYGTTYTSAFDFGNPGDKMYVGDLFTGPGKTVAAFMSQGDPYGQIKLAVSSGTSIHCVSAFGTASDLPVVAGQVTLPVREIPVYVELQANQTIAVSPNNWGSNLALQPGVSASASGDGLNPWNSSTPNSITKIYDGVMRDWFYGQGNNDFPWADDTPYPANYPAWVELDLPSVQTIDKVVVYANPSWELYGSLLDYNLQYFSNGQWVTIDHVQEPANTQVVYTPQVACTCDSFFSDRWIFPHQFAPVTTNKIRLLVNTPTYGGAADLDLANAGYLYGPACINLRQIEVYNTADSGVRTSGTAAITTATSPGPTTSGSGGTTTSGSNGGSSSSAPTSTASAVFIKTDTATEGSWKGKYGADGYNIINNAASYPSYATVTSSAALSYTWTAFSTDLRALLLATASNGGIAACWYTGASNTFTVDINLTDGNAHQFALYALDWDSFGPRSETIQIIDPSTGNVLDSESVSSFSTGKYLVWKVQGHIKAVITNNVPSANGVISGLFFDPASGSAAEPLQLSSTSAFSSSGTVGGPFAPGSDSYVLTDSGTSSVAWKASATQSWLSLSATGGTLSGSGTTTVTASINATANALATGTYADTITFTDLGTGIARTTPVALTVLPPAPVINSSLVATATSGAGFTYQIGATNNPTSFGATGLPAGLGVSAAGVISGTTTVTGTININIVAGNAGGSGSATLVLTVLGQAPVINSALTATATSGSACSYQITATNGPVGFGASGLPSGLAVTSLGLVSGTAATTGTSDVTITAVNASGTGSAILVLNVLPPPPIITSAATAATVTGTLFNYQITAVNTPTSFGASGLPAGLSVSASSGLISGTVTTAGTSNIAVSASNAGGTGAATLLLSSGSAAAQVETLYIAYSNGDNYVEEYSSSGPSGVNVDLGPLPGTTTDTATPNGIAFDSKGNLYIANDGSGTSSNCTITEFAPNGSYIGVFATGLDQPAGMAFDSSGNLYVANGGGNSTITKITPAGVPSTFASTGLSIPQGIAFGPNGNLYVADLGSNSIEEVTPNGQVSTFYKDGSFTILSQIEGIAFDSAGNLYVANNRINTIEEITPAGVATLFASNPSPPSDPNDPNNPSNPQGIFNPIGLTFDSNGDLFVGNFHHTQVPGLPYEGHGISYIDEYSPNGTLINAFTNNPGLPGEDQNLRDGNYIAIKSNSGGTTTSGSGGTTTSGSSGAACAVFIRTDGTTEGSWKGKYGADGYNIVNNQARYPAYATVTSSNALSYTWTAFSIDPRALQLATASSGGIAACLYTGASGSFTIDVNLTDGNAHQVGLYALDWDGFGPRNETIKIIDPSSGNVLDTETVSSFGTGKYLIWRVQGHVQVIVTNNVSGSNAVVSGLFFDPAGAEPLQLPSTAAFTSSGTVGGPFAPGSNGYGLVDSGTSSVTWKASATQSWLSLSSSGGTLAGSGSSTVTASINASANALGSGTYSDTITFTDLGTGIAKTAPVVLTVLPLAPVITSALTATATSGAAFSYQIAASNIPFSFGASGLPLGLNVNATGLISGTTTATGTSNVNIVAGNAGGSGTATLVLTVISPAPVITSALMATATSGAAFSYQIAATNTPTTFGVNGLPAGLGLGANGLISGTATTAGTSSVIVTAGNAAGTGTATLVLSVLPASPVIISSLAATATSGVAFSYQIAATNTPTNFGANGLPAGLNLGSNGVISGTTAATGTSNVNITASNAGGSGTATLVLTVLPPPPVITSSLVATATSGVAFSYQIAGTNTPTSFGASGLPPGLNLGSNGVISGTTAATGTSNVNITASNAGGSGTATLVLTVLPPPPVITSSLVATATSGVAFSYQIGATNTPTGFGANGLPAGLNLGSNGVISGTASATGTSNVNITASNAGGSGTATLVLTVLPPPPVIISSLVATATSGVAFSYQISATNTPTGFGAAGLPAGLGVNSSGLISGSTTATGTSIVTITAGNAGGANSALLALVVLPPAPVISSTLTVNAIAGAAFSYQITASNTPTSFSASGLPAGLALSSSTGLISGTVTTTGTSIISIGATNAGGSGNATLVVTFGVSETLFITYSNGDSYVEEYNSTGPTGINTDLGPLPGTTTDTATPNGIAFDGKGNFYIANDGNGSSTNCTISEFSPSGTYIGVFATGLNQPAGMTFDAAGNLYVANGGNSTITKITPAGASSIFASTGISIPQGLAFGPNGNLYVADLGSNSIEEVTPGGQVSTFYKDGSFTILNQPEGIAFDPSGNLYVANNKLNTIEEITPAGVATVFASNGDPNNPTNPEGIYNPIGLTFDRTGDLFVGNFHHTQVPGLPYEGHGISYIDEYSLNGTLINAFTNNPSLPGEDQNLRDGNYIAIQYGTNSATIESLQVSATAALLSSGTVGGPFAGSSDTYGLANTGATSITWSASATQSWLSLSATGGTLAGGASTTLTASINANANALSSGTYMDTVTITDLGTGIPQTESVVLTVSPLPTPPSITSALAATATTGAAFSYQIAATNTPTTFGASVLPSGLMVSSSSGIISGTALATGTTTFTISAANVAGTGTAPLVLAVVAPGSSGSTAASAVFITTDGTTEGSWKGTYGTDGFNVINNTASYPSYAVVTSSGNSSYTWVSSSADPRALQEPSPSTTRIAACWYTGGSASYSIDVNLTDGNAHQLALYALDWDGLGPRNETIQIIDPSSGNVLDTETVTSFQSGKYLIWKVQGHIKVVVTNNVSGSNAVISGLFFDPAPVVSTPPPTTASAQFVTLDGTTQGNWDAAYGCDGYSVLPGTQNYPVYAAVTPILTADNTWAASTTDVRGLQLMNRLAACWYSGSGFNLDVNLTDGQSHRVAVYAVDWDSFGPRTESVQVVDATSGTVLDTESLASFQSGKYLVWDLKGHVTIKVTNTNPNSNAVISGVFFGAAEATAQTFAGTSGAKFVKLDGTTEGSWKGIYGTDGYNVIDGPASLPAYAAVTPSGNSTYAWAASTTDPRAIELSGGSSRVAGSWINSSAFTVDLNLTDGQAHKVALYALDWDGNGARSETVNVIDPSSGIVLNSQKLSSFQGGQYLVWTLQGHVRLVVTNQVSGSSAVISGLFFGSAGRN